jgi:hypothetical protein
MRFSIFRTKPGRSPYEPHTVKVEEVEVGGDYTDRLGTAIKFPHCDALILHSPGTCQFCDLHPDWQALRSAQGIAFSDDTDEIVQRHSLVPCPSTYRRSAEIRDRWHGNVPATRGPAFLETHTQWGV